MITWWDVLTVSGITFIAGGIGFSLGVHASKRILRQMFIDSMGMTPEEFSQVQVHDELGR